MDAHTQASAELVQQLGTDTALGLTTAQWEARQGDGRNELAHSRGRSLANLVLHQFKDVLVLVLLAACVVSLLLGSTTDAVMILLIVFLNACIGIVQEYRAERTLAALSEMTAPTAVVTRDGEKREVDAHTLVVGDLVHVSAGGIVPADLRLCTVHGLEVDESVLTGESQAITKEEECAVAADAPLGDRRNMAYKATHATRGSACGIVVAIGGQTELGKIAALLEADSSPATPLQKRLAAFSARLTLVIAGVCIVVFAAGVLRGEAPGLMFLTAVSLAVAAVPEAMPAVVTISLAIGARRLGAAKALIRRLPAVETLGSVTTICSDKTGTLTRNEMTLERVWRPGFEEGCFPPFADADPGWRWFLLNAALNHEGQDDPTEVAILDAARAAGCAPQALRTEWSLEEELPFDSQRKRMTTVQKHTSGERLILTKGAPESVAPLCSTMLSASGEVPIDANQILEAAMRLASTGYRVLAFGSRPVTAETSLTPDTIEQDLTLLGLVALIDPPREEALEAVRACQSAGIVPIMITGDHPATAKAIAERLEIAQATDRVVTGPELESWSDAELRDQAHELRVLARVTPAQKTRVVEALQQRGHFVAMTGDGVNDAPALQHADIGVAMGKNGTDVAREASELVLMDDNFATIVAAVAEGRRIFDNIRKFVSYTMTSNSGEIWTLFLAPFLGLPVPLLPIHILWINLVTDGLPGLALTAEPSERGLLQRPPRPPRESLFAHGVWRHVLLIGLLIGALSLGAQAWSYHSGSTHWQTIVFTVLTLSQLWHALASRSMHESLFRLGLWSNPGMLAAVTLTAGLQLCVIYVPYLQTLFKTQALSGTELASCVALSSVVLFACEFEKWCHRRKQAA